MGVGVEVREETLVEVAVGVLVGVAVSVGAMIVMIAPWTGNPLAWVDCPLFPDMPVTLNESVSVPMAADEIAAVISNVTLPFPGTTILFKLSVAVVPLNVALVIDTPFSHSVTDVTSVEAFPVSDKTRLVSVTGLLLGFVTWICCTVTPDAPGAWIEFEGGEAPCETCKVIGVGVGVNVTVGVLVGVDVAVDVFVGTFVDVLVGVGVEISVLVGVGVGVGVEV